MITLSHADAHAVIDPAVGNIPSWTVLARAPLHAAPWRDDPAVQDDPAMEPVNKRLAGDFLCAPFCADNVDHGPMHGLSANTPWDVLETGESHATLGLRATIRGARITKHVRLTGPVLYQTHVLDGGQGRLSLAHHPMTRMAAGGRLCFSPKRMALTDPAPQYAGHNLWALNQMQPDLSMPCEDGSDWDLHDYPLAHKIEDFVILVEARESRLGWTVVMRNAEDDMLVVLKDPRILPITMMWVSNGGRDFPPWNGVHTGVLGVEDGCAAGASGGFAAALEDNRLSALGVPTALTLGGQITVRHAMVSLPRPPGWSDVKSVTITGGHLTLTDVGGGKISVPFDASFFL